VVQGLVVILDLKHAIMTHYLMDWGSGLASSLREPPSIINKRDKCYQVKYLP